MGTPGPNPSVTLDDALAVFDSLGAQCAPLTAAEAATELDCTRRTAHRKLEGLAERGDVETKKVGAHGRVWWRPRPAEPGEGGEPLDGVLDATPGGVIVLAGDGAIRRADSRARDLLGVEADDAGDRSIDDVLDGTADGESPHARAVSTGEPVYDWECRVTTPDGDDRWVRVDAAPVAADGGRVDRVVATVRDVTAHKRREREFDQQRELVDQVFETSPVGIMVLDADGDVVEINEKVRDLLNIPRDDAGSYSPADRTVYDEDGEEVPVDEHPFAETLRTGDPVYDETLQVELPGGERRWLSVSAEPIYGDDGTVDRVVTTGEDVTELKTREQQLRRERDQSEELLSTAPVAITIEEPDGTTVMANRRVHDVLGLSEGELVAESPTEGWTTVDDAGDPLDPPEMPAARVRATGEPVYDEVVGVDPPDGDRLWFSVNAAPVSDGEGELDRVVTAAEDITDLKERTSELRAERDFVERILEAAPMSVLVFDREGDVERMNERARDRLGFEEGDAAVGDRDVYDADGNPVPPAERPYVEAFETGDPVFDWEGQVDLPRGTVWMSMNVVPLGDDEPPERVLVVADNITKQKEQARKLERQRDELEAELEEVLERVTSGFYALDDDWRFTYVNDRAEQLIQRTEGDVLGESIWEVFPGITEGIVREKFHEARETQEAVSFEQYFDALDLWAEVNAYPSASGLSVYFRDVTERKAREQELERYETIVETVKDGVYTVDGDNQFTMVNEAYAELTGYDRSELLGAHVSAVVDEATIEAVADLEAEMLGGARDATTFEAPLLTADGERIQAEASFAILPGDGDTYERVGVVRDVTERKAREQELAEYERIVETVDDGVYVLDERGTFQRMNDAFASMTRFDRSDLLGAHASIVFGDDFQEYDDMARRQFDEGNVEVAVFEEEIHTSADETITVESRFKQFDVEGGQGRVGVLRDITERKAHERELESRARQQAAVSELGRRALEDLDLDALFAEATERVAAVFDNEYAKVLDLDGDERELFLREGVGWEEGLVGEATVGAGAEASQASYTLKASEPVVVEDLQDDDRFDGPPLLTDHGVRSGLSTVIGPNDDPWGILATHDTAAEQFTQEDVDFVQSVANILAEAIERREYRDELEELVADLEESNERLEQFAYVASHDLQEPLRMVSNYLQLVESRYADELDEDGQEFIDFAVDGAERMREMINDLLAYSRVESEAKPPEPTDCEAVVDDVTTSLQFQIESTDATVEVGSLPTVSADRNQLEQVFQNLVSNAIKYRGDDPPRIEIGAEPRGDEWQFHVTDNGVGIEADHQESVFEVFNRLYSHDEYEGTGIGLALCRKIVERHGGEIWIESDPGEGSTFYFTMPDTEESNE